jgi:hypothetical protein
MNFADDGIAGYLAEFGGDCGSALSVGPKGLQAVNAFVCPVHEEILNQKPALQARAEVAVGKLSLLRSSFAGTGSPLPL